MLDDAVILDRGNGGTWEVNLKPCVTEQLKHVIWLAKSIEAALDHSHNSGFGLHVA
jgi:hypothetical protein